MPNINGKKDRSASPSTIYILNAFNNKQTDKNKNKDKLHGLLPKASGIKYRKKISIQGHHELFIKKKQNLLPESAGKKTI